MEGRTRTRRVWSLLLAVLVLVNAIVTVAGSDDDDEFEQELSNGFQCEFQMNEPSWQFKIDVGEQEDEEYVLKLTNIFELSVDANTSMFVQTPINTPFGSIVWSGIQTSATLFTLTGTPNITTQSQSSFSSISYQTPLPSTSDTTTITMSFQFNLNNYQWTSSNNNSKLVFVYALITDDDDQPQNYNYGNASSLNTLVLNNVFFSVSSTSSNNLPVQTLFSGTEFWVIYSHFASSQSLSHGGRFGFLNSQPYGGEGDNEHHSHWWVAVVVLVPILIAILGFIYYRRRRNSFQEMA